MGKLSEILNLAQARAQKLGLPYAGALLPGRSLRNMATGPGAKACGRAYARAEWDWVGRIPGAAEIEWMSYPSNPAEQPLPRATEAAGQPGGAGHVHLP